MQVLFLIGTTGTHHATLGFNHHLGHIPFYIFPQQFLNTRLLQIEMYQFRGKHLMFRIGIQPFQHFRAGTSCLRLSYKMKVIAAVIDLQTQASLDLAQILIQLATEIGQPVIVFRGEYQVY